MTDALRPAMSGMGRQDQQFSSGKGKPEAPVAVWKEISTVCSEELVCLSVQCGRSR